MRLVLVAYTTEQEDRYRPKKALLIELYLKSNQLNLISMGRSLAQLII